MAEPPKVRAGTTVTWTRDLSDYDSATTSSLVYTLSSASGTITITASGSGKTWTVTEAFGVTSSWAADLYAWKLVATVGAAQYLVDEGTIEVVAAAATTNDLITARDRLTAIESEIESRASGKPVEYNVGTADTSRGLKRATLGELQDERKYLEKKVQLLEDAERRKRGQATRNQLKVRFTRP